MVGWLTATATARKVALFMAGALLTLVFDVVVAHVLGKPGIKWTQAIPIVYGSLAALVLIIAVFAAPPDPFHRTVRVTGAVGVLVGLVGAVLHTLAVTSGLAGSELTIRAVTRELSLGPPLFAPLAFAGVGL